MNASKKRYDSKYKVTRIWLADYQLLKELSQRAGISMAECLHKLIVKQAEPKAEVPMPIFFKPKAVSEPIVAFVPKAVSEPIVAFKPKAVSGNGVAHIKLKSIEEV